MVINVKAAHPSGPGAGSRQLCATARLAPVHKYFLALSPCVVVSTGRVGTWGEGKGPWGEGVHRGGADGHVILSGRTRVWGVEPAKVGGKSRC